MSGFARNDGHPVFHVLLGRDAQAGGFERGDDAIGLFVEDAGDDQQAIGHQQAGQAWATMTPPPVVELPPMAEPSAATPLARTFSPATRTASGAMSSASTGP